MRLFPTILSHQGSTGKGRPVKVGSCNLHNHLNELSSTEIILARQCIELQTTCSLGMCHGSPIYTGMEFICILLCLGISIFCFLNRLFFFLAILLNFPKILLMKVIIAHETNFLAHKNHFYLKFDCSYQQNQIKLNNNIESKTYGQVCNETANFNFNILQQCM